MKNLTRLALAAAAVAAASPALAQDAFQSFNGTNGNGGFSYGYTNGTALTAFDATGGCVLGAASTCLHASGAALPQASVGGSYFTVSVPTDAILLHPGNSGALSVYSLFTPTLAGAYNYTINLESVGTDTTNGTGYQLFTSIGGVVTPIGPRGTLPTYRSTGLLTGTQALLAGQSLGVFIDYNGDYGGDSTGLNFSLSAVPEPATWGMMVMGFGLVGFGLRARRSTKARFA